MQQLRVYCVEDWSSVDSGVVGTMLRMTDGGGTEDLIMMSRSVHHGDGPRSVTVTSSHPTADDLVAAGRQIADDRGYPGSWTPVTIPVDGRDEVFQRGEVGSSWVAVATVDGVTITVTGRHVDMATIRLIEDRDAEAPQWHRPVSPPPCERVFPATSEPAAAGTAPVDLTFRNRRALTGTLGGTAVELITDLPAHNGSIRGRVGGAAVSAQWTTEDEEVILSGDFAGLPVAIQGRFRHAEGGWFDTADVAGQVGPHALHARVERADGGLSSDTVYAEGTLADVAFSVWATTEGDLSGAVLHGAVGGRPFELAVTSDYRHVHVSGAYDGPDSLVLLIVGGLANFI